jgi:DNA-binding NarL/FixJ family response regulator
LDIDDLSDRELQVFENIGRGLTIIEIAERLKLSAHTVETYRQRIKTKLHFKTNSELTTKAAHWVLEHEGN